MLQTYQSAHPSQLAHVYSHVPPTANSPLAYVDKRMPERIVSSTQLRQRVISATIIVLNRDMSHLQSTDEQDLLVDGLLDAISAAYNTAVTGARIYPVGVDDAEVTIDTATYAGFALTIEASIQEGRNT